MICCMKLLSITGKMIMRTPLPGVRTNEEFDEGDATTLIVTMVDTFTGLEFELVYTGKLYSFSCISV